MARDGDSTSRPGGGRQQLELPLGTRKAPRAPEPLRPPAGPKLRLVRGEGQRRDETLRTRDDVARLLAASAADMLLRRISCERAHEIQLRVDRAMRLFGRCEGDPRALPLLRRELDELERVWREGQRKRGP